jgi:hypothetical protein
MEAATRGREQLKNNGGIGYPDSNQTLSGVDVMQAIFGDFCQFSAEKIGFISKTNVMIKFL